MTNGNAVRDYRSNGYCIIENALSPGELRELRSACDLLLKEKPVDGGGKFHDIGRGDARRFLRHRHVDQPQVRAFVFGETMYNIARALLGEHVYLFNEQFVVKGAKSGASFAWHQDGAYVGFDHKPYVTVWIALDDTTEENGCVYILPRNLDRDETLVDHRWDAEGKEKVGYEGPDQGIPAVVPAGSVVAFSSTTFHRSGANTTVNIRRAYLCQYSPEPILDPETQNPKHFATKVTGPTVSVA